MAKKLIRDWMELTDEQIDCVMEYINTNRNEFVGNGVILNCELHIPDKHNLF